MKGSSKPRDEIIPLDLIESLVQEKRYKEALAEIRENEALNRVERFSRQWGWLCYLAAKTLQGLGRSEEALSWAQKAWNIFKDTLENEKLAQIQFRLGVIYSDLGDLKNAELQFKDAASTYRRVEHKEGIVRAYNALSRICFTKARYEAALEYLQDGLQYCEEIKDQKLSASILGNLGTVYMILDRWEKARQHLSQSLELNRSCQSQINLCRAYLSLGCLSILCREFSEAEGYLKEASQLIYENSFGREAAIFHEYSGELAFMRGEWDAAQQHYLKAIELGEQLAPKSAIISQAYRLLAELLMERGDHQEALVCCEKSLEASRPIGERLEEAIVCRTLARIYSQNGDPALVKKNFSQAIDILEDIGVKLQLVRTYQDMCRSESFRFWEKMKFLSRAEDLASQLDSSYYLAQVHATFAKLLYENDEPDEALKFLTKAKRILEQLEERKDLRELSFLEKKISQKSKGQVKSPIRSTYLNSSASPQEVHASSVSFGSNLDLSFSDFVTQDETTLEILQSVRQIKDLDLTVVLEGETGTGKDLLAKIIHYTSHRRNNRFVVVNCSALPETLLESELFGHKKGSFTGAVADKSGLLEEAKGGTLYLDEIGEVPLSIQVKLLRAIEEKEFLRVGEVKPRKVDFRVIAATNRDLDELMQESKFRSDLFYRLSAIRIKLPPLREKREDIPLLVEHFIQKYSFWGIEPFSQKRDPSRLSKVPIIDPKVLELFLSYHWPGNIRELENEVKRLLIASAGKGEISFALLARSLEKFANGSKLSINGEPPSPPSLLSRTDQYEKEQIEKALAKCIGVKTKAARLLNIDESLLRYKIKKYNISSPSE